jgi:EAL domain-containing protein (putative c-di-GMP-specific phosphodiesterase class I)/FixJ family two-component response regulator
MRSSIIPFGSKSRLPAGKPSRQNMRSVVHIVDDMADQLHFLRFALEQAGYQTVFHLSLEDFAGNVSHEDAKAVLIDVRLGEDDATDVLDFLCRSRWKADIYLTSGDSKALEISRRYAEEIGLKVEAVIPKPFTGKQVVERLARKRDGLKDMFSQLDIAEAMRQGWIYGVLQPKLDLISGKIRSAELLSRVEHPEFGFIPPQSFINQMNPEQSQTLFMQHVAFIRRHFETGAWNSSEFRININIDPINLVNVRSRMKALAAESPDLFKSIVFEITEESLSEVAPAQLKNLYKMSLDGAIFSIDDFGTGLSNFSRLSRFPFSEIKIDRSIIHGCSGVSARRILVKSIINMAHDMGAKAVAEGVEAVNDFAFLREIGCDEIQGYLVARPMKIDKFCAFVSDYNNNDVSGVTTLAPVMDAS